MRVLHRLPRWLLGATLVAAASVSGIAALVRRSPFLRVAVAGESMTPALQPDEFLVLRAGPPREDRAYGQVVALLDPRPALERPEGEPRLLLKRIVGLPGESLRVGGGVQINGRVLDEAYAHGETPHEQHRGINRIEAGYYFVMGDHRGASTDSRDFGPIHRDQIVGTAVLRYWPPERFGRLVPPARVLLGVADLPPAPPAPPRSAPLPWLGQREVSSSETPPPASE
jgi:signal peptidase I